MGLRGGANTTLSVSWRESEANGIDYPAAENRPAARSAGSCLLQAHALPVLPPVPQCMWQGMWRSQHHPVTYML